MASNSVLGASVAGVELEIERLLALLGTSAGSPKSTSVPTEDQHQALPDTARQLFSPWDQYSAWPAARSGPSTAYEITFDPLNESLEAARALFDRLHTGGATSVDATCHQQTLAAPRVAAAGAAVILNMDSPPPDNVQSAAAVPGPESQPGPNHLQARAEEAERKLQELRETVQDLVYWDDKALATPCQLDRLGHSLGATGLQLLEDRSREGDDTLDECGGSKHRGASVAAIKQLVGLQKENTALMERCRVAEAQVSKLQRTALNRAAATKHAHRALEQRGQQLEQVALKLAAQVRYLQKQQSASTSKAEQREEYIIALETKLRHFAAVDLGGRPRHSCSFSPARSTRRARGIGHHGGVHATQFIADLAD